MLSDRPYMRGDYQRERTSTLTWLISAIIAGFILQLVMGSVTPRGGTDLMRALVLSVPGLHAGWIWTLLTHAFFHDPHFLIHIAVNLLVLYLLGRELLPMLGSRRFLGLFATATVVSGLIWALVHWRDAANPEHMGATAAIDALFVVFACFFPNKELNFLLLFLFPVTLKPKHIVGALVLFDVFGLIFWEIPGLHLPFDVTVASSAHLAGMLTGFLYYRFMYDERWFGRERHGTEIELPRWLKRTKKAPTAPPAYHVNLGTPEDIRAEVDRILDKINSQGFSALTPDEKRVLDEARDQLSRR